jgi:hypothetical protein
MTTWTLIDLEYDKMLAAQPLALQQLNSSFRKAFVEFAVQPVTQIPNNYFFLNDQGDLAPDHWYFGNNAEEAGTKFDEFIESPASGGFFDHAGQGGWFYVAAADKYAFSTVGSAPVPYPKGPATVTGNLEIQLPVALPASPAPKLVYLDDLAGSGKRAAFDVASMATNNGVTTLTLKPHEYFRVDNLTDRPDWTGDLPAYTFPVGSNVQVEVKGAGATVIGGLSNLAGRAVVFTGEGGTAGTIVEKLTHSFGLAHRCGNWDYRTYTADSSRRSFAMVYWYDFVLTHTTRVPIPWTDYRMDAYLCAEHIVGIRQSHLEDNARLGW